MHRIIRTFSLLSLFLTTEAIAQGPSDPADECLIARYNFRGDATEPVNGYNGSDSGLTYASDRWSNPNGAAYFDGSSAFVELPTAFDIPNKTIVIWFKPDSVGTNTHSMYDLDNPNLNHGKNGFSVYQPNDSVILRLRRGGANSGVDVVVDPNDWSMATMSMCSTGKTSFYLNGDSTGEVNQFATSQNGANFAQVGRSRVEDRYYNGWIDEIRIYNCCLTSAEISSIYALDEDPPLGVGESLNALDWKVLPTSTSFRFRVEMPEHHDDQSIRVMDLQGRVVQRQMLNSNLLDFDGFSPGMYFVQMLQGGEDLGTQRIVLP